MHDQWGRECPDLYSRRTRDLIRRELCNLHNLPTLILGVLDDTPRSAAEIADLVLDDLEAMADPSQPPRRYSPQQVAAAMRQVPLEVLRDRDPAGVLRYSCHYEDC